MKKHLKLLFATTIVLSGIGTGRFALATPNSADTNAEIEFTLDPGPSEITTPDPDVPDGETPDDGGSGSGGLLRIDHVSNFNFGLQYLNPNTGGTFHALGQTWGNGAYTTSPFIQVTDARGTHTGWNLHVEQNGQFENANGERLDGASLRLTHLQTSNTAHEMSPAFDMPVTGSYDANGMIALAPNGGSRLIATADVDAGVGETHIIFGFMLPTGFTSGVQLSVPPYTSLPTDLEFSTSLTWTLSNTPTAP